MRVLVVLALLLCVIFVNTSAPIHEKDDVSSNAKKCQINCEGYVNGATGRTLCSCPSNNNNIHVQYVGPRCPSLDEVQKLYPKDQVKVMSAIVDFCRTANKCTCEEVNIYNSDIVQSK
ncbi:hypothetical protein AKO1_003425 [Acrasis kona]|uniref:Uncharacterized protein n=1 Tax=Acrasis kona TaxID=1008807 RepID=A0AAW2ZCN6_9EUKA